MKQRLLMTTTVVLAVIFLGLLIFAACVLPNLLSVEAPPVFSSEPTVPSSEQTESTEGTEATEPSETTLPTQTTEPPVTSEPTEATQPSTEPGVEYIGNLYTRQELEAMENVTKEFGPGRTYNGERSSAAEKNQNTYGKYGGHFIAPANGCVYLTFDCGYEYQNLTADILDILKEKNVKAVFFITLNYAKKNPELVWRMINEGHIVGNHSSNHPSMPSCTIDQMVTEVMDLHNYMLEHFGYGMTLFRPPTGTFSTRSLAVVQSLGYKSVFWSFAYPDWDTENQPEQAAALERITISHHSGAIYLLHAISRTNVAVLGDAIDFFRAQRYTLELFQ